jgi:Bacterial Ig domain
VQGILSGKGVVYDPNPEGGIRGIDILIDGIAMDFADTELARADFCASNRVQGCPNVGFSFQIPLARFNLKPGPHTLQLVAINRRAYFVYAPAEPMTFTVDPGEPSLGTAKVESPTAGQEVSGSITLRGYAYSDAYAVSAVDVLIDGVTAGRATYNATRADICGPLTPAPPNCPRIGWTYTLNTRLLTNGEHTLALRVIDSTGRYPAQLLGSTPFTVNNPAQEPTTAVITAPVHNQAVSGVMRISGYAYAPSARVARVVLFIDDYQYNNLTYGSARPEACAGLAGVSACPNIGFDGEFDTTRLVNGPHFINIVVQDSANSIVVVPNTLVGGLNITVKN